MPPPPSDLSHLAALISAARAEAERLGPAAREADGHLAAAAAAVGPEPGRASAGAGPADQGIRLADLTTDNDK